MNNYLCLYANCIPVKGHNRSIICDLQKDRYKIIPNELYDILIEIENLPFEQILSVYPDKEGLELYVNKLLDEDFLFFTDIPSSFPKLSMDWDSPSLITNAILDLVNESSYDLVSAIQQLESLGCKAIEVRCYDDSLEKHLFKLLEGFTDSKVSFIQIYVGYKDIYTQEYFEKIHKINLRFNAFIIHSSPFFQEPKEESPISLLYTPEIVNSERHCGLINAENFIVNIPFFTEAQTLNSCLNRKLGIDKEGFIKNCPAMSIKYGHIEDTKLKEIVSHTEFKKFWQIDKSQINTCKDCEFRYICTDCRALLENETDIYSKPKFCNYDPYTSTWQ